MGKKICPICDGPLGIGDYCTTCKRRIKTPIIISSNMHLNERHPMVETDCEYHGDPNKASSFEQMTEDDAEAKRKAFVFDGLSGKNWNANMNLVKYGVIAVFVMCSLMVPIAKFAISSLRHSSYQEVEEAPAAVELKTEYLTLEEAKAYGSHCSASDHLPIYKEATLEYLRSWFEEEGFVIAEERNSIYNIIEYYGDEEQSYFLDTDYIRLGISENSGQIYYLQLSSDSATGEFHSVNASVKNLEDAKKLIIDFNTYMESVLGISTGESGLSNDIGNLEITENGESFNTGYGYFFVNKEDDGYSIYINGIEEE